MPIVDVAEWNQYVEKHPSPHLLQTGEWGELKSAFGWKPVRIVSGDVGVQILFRKLPLGFTVGYIPKAMVSNQRRRGAVATYSVFSEQFVREIDDICRKQRVIFLKLEPDAWEANSPKTIYEL